jgi:microcystin-dependent protein
MAANATSSGTANVTVFPNGNGDGSTTFNLPNCQNVVLAGRGNMSGTPRALLTSTYFGTNPDALGAFGGNQNVTMAAGNLIQHTHANTLTDPGHGHPGSAGVVQGSVFNITSAAAFGGNNTGAQSTQALSIANNTTGITINNANAGSASPTPMRTVQPTLTANCMIRVLAMIDAAPNSASFAVNDNLMPIADRRQFAMG